MSKALHSHKGTVTEWEVENTPPSQIPPVQEGLPEKPVGDVKLDDISADIPAVEVQASPAEPSLLTSPGVFTHESDADHSLKMLTIHPTQWTLTEVKKEKKLAFKSTREKVIFGAFIIPPLAISFISMLHMITLFETSNVYWMAVAIAVAVEFAAMSSLVALVTLDKLNKTTIWSIFGVLASLQILGNMYQTFVSMSPESAQTILNLLALDSTPWSLRLVNFIVGGILPVISLTFVKGIVDYFKE